MNGRPRSTAPTARRGDLKSWRGGTGLTLIELMVVVAIVGVIALLAVPSVRDFILMQRLRSINAQLVTDLQFARSEAVRRGQILRVVFLQDGGQTCYALYTSPDQTVRCSCLQGAGAACSGAAGAVEVRTVVVPRALGVTVLPVNTNVDGLGFEPATGGLVTNLEDSATAPLAIMSTEVRVDAQRRLRTSVVQSGRASVCAPDATTMQVPACT